MALIEFTKASSGQPDPRPQAPDPNCYPKFLASLQKPNGRLRPQTPGPRPHSLWSARVDRNKFYKGVILLVLVVIFHFKWLYRCEKFFVEPFRGYLRHFPDTGEYVSKKSYGHTMPRNEYKAGK